MGLIVVSRDVGGILGVGISKDTEVRRIEGWGSLGNG